MTINLSDETLDHLRYHLDVLAKDYTTQLAKAPKVLRGKPNKLAENIARRLTEVRDLQHIFDECIEVSVNKPLPANVVATQEGSVFHFALDSDEAVNFINENFAIESWQWLGKRAVAIDHRFAPQVVCQLRDAGFSVEVR